MKCFCGNNTFYYTNVSKHLYIHQCAKTFTICDISRGKYIVETSKRPPCDFYKEIDKEGIVSFKNSSTTKINKKQKLNEIIITEKQKIKRYQKAPIIMGIELNEEEEQIFLNMLYSPTIWPETISEKSKNNIHILYLLCNHKKFINSEITYKKVTEINEEPFSSKIISPTYEDIYVSDMEEDDTSAVEELDEDKFFENLEDEEDSENSDEEQEEDIIYDL